MDWKRLLIGYFNHHAYYDEHDQKHQVVELSIGLLPVSFLVWQLLKKRKA